VAALQLATSQPFGATHTTGVPPVQLPAWHASPWVHAFPSLHAVPFETGVFEHVPFVLHESVVHGLPSLHCAGVHVEPPPELLPELLPELPELPPELLPDELPPELLPELLPDPPELLDPPVVHVPLPLHVPFGQVVPASATVVPTQTPTWQASALLQTLPSLHVVPSGNR
jgi:hypothetical protein